MAHSPMNYLFNDHDMFSWLDAHQKQISEIVQQMQANTLLSRPTDDVVAEVVDRLRMEVPVIHRDRAHAEQSEAQVRNPNHEDYGFRGQSPHVTGTKVTLHIPYSGNRDFFRVTPTTFDNAPPNASYDGNELAISVSGRQLNPEAVKKHLNDSLESIEKYLGWQRTSVDGFNASLEGHARSAVEARKAKLLGDQNLVSNLGFPLKHTNAPQTYVAPVKRKSVIQRPPTPVTAPFKPEPAMDPGAVGTAVDVRHLAATPLGHDVRADAEVIKVDGKRIEFKVSASDKMEEIGSGTHVRTVINLRSFNERLAKKSRR
jgi:hypothetical protein